MQTTLNVPVRVELDGVKLTRIKKMTVSNGKKKEVMETKVRLWANATVIDVSEERNSNIHGPYCSVHVRFRPGEDGYVIGYENRDSLFRLQPGRKYNFEGAEGYGKGGGFPMLNCHSIVTGTLSVSPIDEE